jgi:hypothetical protein
MNPHADPRESHRAKNTDNQRLRCVDCGRREKEYDQPPARCKTPGLVERESAQQAAVREVPGVVEPESAQKAATREEPAVREGKSRQRRELLCTKNADHQRLRHADCGRGEEENNQQGARCETPGVVNTSQHNKRR